MKTWLAWLLAGAIALVALGCNSAPTLPLPPPVAEVNSPDSEGYVVVEGEVSPGAFVAVFNEDAGRGLIETPDEDGAFSVRIQAAVGDLLTVWAIQGGDSGQRKQVSEILHDHSRLLY